MHWSVFVYFCLIIVVTIFGWVAINLRIAWKQSGPLTEAQRRGFFVVQVVAFIAITSSCLDRRLIIKLKGGELWN